MQPPKKKKAEAENRRAWVSSAPLGTQHDGSEQYFAGCYQTHKVNNGPLAAPGRFQQAQLRQVPAASGTSRGCC